MNYTTYSTVYSSKTRLRWRAMLANFFFIFARFLSLTNFTFVFAKVVLFENEPTRKFSLDPHSGLKEALERRGSHGASLRVFKIIQVRSFTMFSPSFSPGATAYLLALGSGLLAEATGAGAVAARLFAREAHFPTRKAVLNPM